MSKEQVLDQAKIQKEWTRSLLAVPFVQGHWTVTLWTEKRLRVYKSSSTMIHHAWRVDKAPAKTHKNRIARLDALRSAVPQQIACLYGLRCELVNITFLINNPMNEAEISTE